MPTVAVELPSGEVQNMEISPEMTLREIADMVGVNPKQVSFFEARNKNGVLGNGIRPLHAKFGSFKLSSIVVVDRKKINPKNANRFMTVPLNELNHGGSRRRKTARRRRASRQTRRY